jgi:hypothetical protein
MKYLAVTLAVALLGILHASAVTFSGTDGTLDFNAASGSFTLSGIKVTISANDGMVNATSAGLGINDSLTGDDTHGLDTIHLTEVMTLSFDKAVNFDSISLANVGPDDALSIQIGSFAPIIVTGSSTFPTHNFVGVGQTVILTAVAPNAPTPNNGVDITSFSVTAVPEPHEYSVIIGGMLVALAVMRRRRALRQA